MLEILIAGAIGMGGFCAAQLWAINAKLAVVCQKVSDHGRRLGELERAR